MLGNLGQATVEFGQVIDDLEKAAVYFSHAIDDLGQATVDFGQALMINVKQQYNLANNSLLRTSCSEIDLVVNNWTGCSEVQVKMAIVEVGQSIAKTGQS